jgi:hypothetical protein
MSKSGRGRAPRDRRRPYRFPRPPCEPEPPRAPEPVRPRPPGCDTGPDPAKLIEKLKRKKS